MEFLYKRNNTCGNVFRGIRIILIILATSTVCHASCSCCSFQWVEYKNQCYRYFPQSLPYEEAEEYCQSKTRGKGGNLMKIDSLDEMMIVMEYIGNIIGDEGSQDYVWMTNGSGRKYDNHSMILFKALGENEEPNDRHLSSCSAFTASVPEVGKGTFRMVPAPEMVDQTCAVYTSDGSFMDLGDFAGTCVSDPDVCVSETVTWSIWLKINSTDLSENNKYYISAGGRTRAARGIALLFQNQRFLFVTRSFKKCCILNFRLKPHEEVPIDEWFHFVATIDLTQASVDDVVAVYINGIMLTPDTSINEVDFSNDDKCTRLCLGGMNPCNGVSYPSSVYRGSAAYSNLMVFDGLLTHEHIQNLHACGSLDWGLRVRSLYSNNTYTLTSNRLRYVCRASASTGPTISWSVYRRDPGSWDNLGSSTGVDFEITMWSLSPCVSESVLEIAASHGPVSVGDVISCTASSGSSNASVYIYQGKNKQTVAYNDHDKLGLLHMNNEGYYHSINVTTSHPFYLQEGKSLLKWLMIDTTAVVNWCSSLT